MSDDLLAQQIGLSALQVSQLRAVSRGNAPLQDDAGGVSDDEDGDYDDSKEDGIGTKALSVKVESTPTDVAPAASEAALETNTEGAATPLPTPPLAPEQTTVSPPPEPLIEAPPAATSQSDDVVDLPTSNYTVGLPSHPNSDELTARAGVGNAGSRRISVRRRSSGAESWIVKDSTADDGSEVRRRSSIAVAGEIGGDSGSGLISSAKLPASSPQLRSAAIRLNTNLAKVQQKQRRMTMMSGAQDWELHAMAASAAAATTATSSSENVAESSRDGHEAETKDKEKMAAARRWDFLNEMNPEILSSRLEKAGPTAAGRWVTPRNKPLARGHSDDTDSVHSGKSSVASSDITHENDDDDEEMTFNVTSPVHAALIGQSPNSGSGHKQFTVSDIIKAFGGGKGHSSKSSSGGRSRRSGDKVDGKTGAAATEDTTSSSSSSSARPRRRSSLARLDKKSHAHHHGHNGGGSGGDGGGSEEKSGVRRLRELFEKKPREEGISPPPPRHRKHSHASTPTDQSTLPTPLSEISSPPNVQPALPADSSSSNDGAGVLSSDAEGTFGSAQAVVKTSERSSTVRRSLALFQSPQALAAVKGRLPTGGRGGRGSSLSGRGGQRLQRKSQVAGGALNSASDAAAGVATALEEDDDTRDKNDNNIKEEDEDVKGDSSSGDVATEAKDPTISEADEADAHNMTDGKGEGADKDGEVDDSGSSSGNDSDASGSDRSGSSSENEDDNDDNDEVAPRGGHSKKGSSSGGGGKDGGSIGAAMFSEAELLSLKLLFAIMDHDGNERIEKEELAA